MVAVDCATFALARTSAAAGPSSIAVPGLATSAGRQARIGLVDAVRVVAMATVDVLDAKVGVGATIKNAAPGLRVRADGVR